MHFTYKVPTATDLEQGDILERTEAIDSVLEQVHPHYARKADYGFFVVLTQSCDLVRRTGTEIAARYVVIAAARPLHVAVERYAATMQYLQVERSLHFGNQDRKEKVRAFIERLLNNNEKDYFFLRAEPARGLQDDHCVFLQLSVALKADLHYETLRSARILSLNESFQHKLGHLVGTSYSRIGTEDWVPNHFTKKEFQDEVNDRLRLADNNMLWVPQAVHKRLVASLGRLSVEEHTPDRLEALISEIGSNTETKKQQLLAILSEELDKLSVDGSTIEKTKKRLSNNPTFNSIFRN